MDFSAIFLNIKQEASGLAKQEFSGMAKQAIKDSELFLEASKAKLEKWTMALAAGELDKAEFAKLVDDQQVLGQMKLLTKAGVAQVKVDSFVIGLKNIIIDNILKTIL